MRKHFLAGILCLSQLFAFAADPENSWKKEYSDNEIIIESSVIIFEDQKAGTKHERVIFKYTNLTSKNIVVSHERLLYYDGVCYGCDKQEKKYEVALAPLQSKEFSNENKDKTYYIFSKDIKNTIHKKLDKFTIVKIEKLAK